MVVEATEDPSEAAAKKQIQDDQRTETDEMASLKLMVSALEDRACAIEAQFHEYCDMKEQESAYQKMQIMCLGMKLELLESQNQRLEAAAAEIRAGAEEIRAGAEEFAAMRGKLERLQGKLKTMSKRSKQDSDAVGERIVALDAKQAQMAARCEEFEQDMEEMKQLTVQLLEQKGANNEVIQVH
jgi:chromosome segregation ATPase